ncbi:MAG TPA: FHA domain-containing protein [Luteitalea sp.]|nr:FHA domain-containing protein [Luteitalea sp.]
MSDPRGDSPISEIVIRLTDGRELRFARPFTVGRSAECDVQLDDEHVSRKHLRVAVIDGHWTFTDLQSANGLFLNGARVASGAVGDGVTIRMGGLDGPPVLLRAERAAFATVVRPARVVQSSPASGAGSAAGQSGSAPIDPRDPNVLKQFEARYFGKGEGDDQPVGARTMYIREAFQQVQKRQKRRYGSIVAAISVVALLFASYAAYLHVKARQNRKLAEDIFYSIKNTDVLIAQAEQNAGAGAGKTLAQAYQQRKQSEAQYDQLLQKLDIYGRKLTEEERLILRVTRTFGECELVVPPEYLGEVSRYIASWRRTPRFVRGIRKAQERGYVQEIVKAFMAQNLPPQFFYLALQESDFNEQAVGPPTNWGFAKGMWQFIPDTGKTYGLTIGPWQKHRVFDPQDDRHDWQKATGAAARYIKTIYATDAQASGLLVMASYNWGERRVVRYINQLPANPRDRNFWNLLEQYRSRVPAETYNYVFSIVSAAVIGENPRLFGFPFDNPLEAAINAASANTQPPTGPVVVTPR